MSSAGAGGKPSRSAIVADTESGHHLLTIHGYSRTMGIPTGACVRSSPFTIGGHRWSIDYYPNGMRSGDENYISLSLILDKTSRRRTFLRRTDLENSRHLVDDLFTIRCDMVVIHTYRALADAAASVVSVPPCDLCRHLAELLRTEKGADVVFEVGGETVAAHRCVLAARSSVFSAELFGPMMEGNADSVVVRIQDMDAEVFKALLHFVYTGSLPETPRNEDEDVTYQHPLVAADRYGIERLKLICVDKLCEYINVGSAAIILALAEQHHCEGLKKACFDFLASPANLRAVMATDGFQHLIRSCPSLMVELISLSCALAE
ncbi:unnamed protein product [Alopecurus aequalis]